MRTLHGGRFRRFTPRWAFVGLVWLLVATAATAAGHDAPPTPVEPGTLFQVSVIGAISSGVYDGAMTVGELARHGNFGLGATHALAGEMVVYGGRFYEIGMDGRARPLHPDERVTFAAVTFFEPEVAPEIATRLTEGHTAVELEQRLLERIEIPAVPHAVWVSGRFRHVKTRAPRPQTKPYPKLEDALADQMEFDFHDVRGTMVGFWTPAYLSGLHAPGFHFHFIAADGEEGSGGSQGGHVLAYETADVAVALAALRTVEVRFPVDDDDFIRFQPHP